MPGEDRETYRIKINAIISGKGAAGREYRKRAYLPFANILAGNQKPGKIISVRRLPLPEMSKLTEVFSSQVLRSAFDRLRRKD